MEHNGSYFLKAKRKMHWKYKHCTVEGWGGDIFVLVKTKTKLNDKTQSSKEKDIRSFG